MVVGHCFGERQLGEDSGEKEGQWGSCLREVSFFCSVIPLRYTTALGETGETGSGCWPGGAEVKTIRSN